jgi:hypothetical protein
LRGREGVPVGAGEEWMGSGDACVALAGGGRRARDQDVGDASVPTPHNPSPAPTGMRALPKRNHKKPGCVCGPLYFEFELALVGCQVSMLYSVQQMKLFVL